MKHLRKFNEEMNSKRYLKVSEFVELAENSDSIVIYTMKNGKLRCKCTTPVTNLYWNDGELGWSDADGDPHFSDLTENTIMKNLTDDGEYFTSVYVFEENNISL